MFLPIFKIFPKFLSGSLPSFLYFTCAGGNPGPAWTPGAAYVKVVEDAFETGKIALVVAGTNAADTRLATSLLSQGKLEDQTASGVKVSGTVTAPVVTPM